MVEFALLAPVLIFLFIGMVDLGRSMYFGILATNAARAGASYGSQNLQTAQDANGMQNAANQDAAGVPWTVTATPLCSVNGVTPASCSNAGGGPPVNTVYYVKVQVNGSFAPLIQYPGIRNPIPVSGTSEMRVVNQ
jgi:Flp pilus assembly protein TadG